MNIPTSPKVHLSVVAVTCNDDHGGDLRGRMYKNVSDGKVALHLAKST